jgi:hypothetical protein
MEKQSVNFITVSTIKYLYINLTARKSESENRIVGWWFIVGWLVGSLVG